MKLTSIVISLMALFSFASADNLPDKAGNAGNAAKVTAYHNAKYDSGGSSINTVTCFNDQKAEYPTLNSLPNYPNIGGYNIGGYSAPCGTCWGVTYDSASTFYVLSVDSSNKGFQVSQTTLTNLGKKGKIHGESSSLDVKVTAVDMSKCGL